MVFNSDRVDSAEGDECMVYVARDKEEDTEMQMLTPIMLESMTDLHSPFKVFRLLKEIDKPDDATEATTESFSDIMLPTFETPPRITNAFDDDDASEVSFDSYGLGEVPSPRNVMSTNNVSNYPLRIPSDVLYEGEVAFSIAHVARRIHLQPRRSAHADSIFVSKTFNRQDYPFYPECILADSLISANDKRGTEECKDDDGGAASYDEGLAYVVGDRLKDEQHWGEYPGHYGSRDFEEDDRGNIDYALDHASVQEVSIAALPLSTRHESSTHQPSAESFLDDLHEFFTTTCFSCNAFT